MEPVYGGILPWIPYELHAVNKIASRVWRSHGLEDVRTTAAGFMIFRFKTEDQMLEILERGPWLFGSKAIILQQWHPHFVFDKSKISKLPVWIRLHGLPFPLWSRRGLSMVASMVGRPLACDEATFTGSRLDFARVCVEIDAMYHFVHHFNVITHLSKEPLHIEVEFEWKPTRCAKCHKFGHACSTDEIPTVPERDGTSAATMVATKGKGVTQDANPSRHDEVEGIPGKKPLPDKSTSATATEVFHVNSAPQVAVMIPTHNSQKTTLPHSTKHQNNRAMESKPHLSAGTTDTSGLVKEPVANFGDLTVKDLPNQVRSNRDTIEETAGKENEPLADEVSATMCARHTRFSDMVASPQSQPFDEEDDIDVDSGQLEYDLDNRDTSSSSYTKVKKKKGGKKKNKEARCL
ncbi:GLYCINE-RICH CELL WALL STRUCTURAL PROTEIN 1.8-LIKE [Salix viminalis]|uniref:GLYCINE-RICH CELL WALL STRUCTURAL PROTEIN 1.8-LIKE n=1 Tax=Salix viminalis TaxID=40686 RepID=A0A9Q0NHN7_SALVM|nr:GLYCINE-RICH CELL WALL STRUCTURAL PROTEIN 1.8-LIKE [Salix viminalis]